MDTVPRVIEGVAHYVCIGIMQLSEHLKRDCGLINLFFFFFASQHFMNKWKQKKH